MTKEISEDAPTVNAGSGEIAGIGTTNDSKPSNWGEPGFKKKRKKNIIRRGVFAGEETFVVPFSIFEKARLSKRKGQHWSTFLSEDDIDDIREFANKYPHKPIIFEDEKSGTMCYARYGKSK
jgi:hypothetical protein